MQIILKKDGQKERNIYQITNVTQYENVYLMEAWLQKYTALSKQKLNLFKRHISQVPRFQNKNKYFKNGIFRLI